VTTIKTLVSCLLDVPQTALGFAGLFFVAGQLAAQTPLAPDYRVGDRAEAEVVTPIPLVVFDAARTDSLRRAEAQKATPIFRWWRGASKLAEDGLVETFRTTRDRFAEGLEDLFNHPLPLLTTELGQPQFGEFVATFREQSPGFPLSTNLAELWALGDTGDLVLDRLRATLRQFTNSYVRADTLPAGEKLTPSLVRLIPVEPTNAPLSLADVDRLGRNLARSNLVTATKFHQGIVKSIGERPAVDVQFVVGFLQPNCFFDEALTQQARKRRTESINAADRYEVGAVLVKSGEVVTARTKLALDELRARTEPDRVQAELALERSRADSETAKAMLATQTARQTNRRLWVGLGVSGAVCLLLLGAWLRRRSAASRGSLALAIPGHDEEAHWRERAMEAEARAEKATALLRRNLLPHLARWMMNEVMQRLLSQRSETQSTQQMAEREVAELAKRLASVHAPLEDRLKAYERRIAELEAELAAKGEQNLELIKAKIETTRKKLEGERSDEPLNWN